MEKEQILSALFTLIEDRKQHPKEGSYTNYLLEKGLDKVLKKVGEEATETVIAAKNQDKENLVGEVADLVYHITVLLSMCDSSWDAVFELLEKRELKQGNLKQMHKKADA